LGKWSDSPRTCGKGPEKTRFLQSLLFEAPPFDGVVVGTVVCLLLLSSTLACIRPALEASKPDLATLLKQSD
jgi:hypothetical protein